MRHTPDGQLRRLDDEPLAVPDRMADHVAVCGRCSTRRRQMSLDTERCARLLTVPPVVTDADPGPAWLRFQRAMKWSEWNDADRRRVTVSVPRRSPRFVTVSMRTGMIMGAVGVVVAGTAAAAALSSVFAPTHVATVPVSQSDLQAIASFSGLGGSQVLGGFPTPSGSRRFAFGTIQWSTSSVAQHVDSLSQATAKAGFAVPLPSVLPSGVGRPQRFVVQPRVHAVVTFNSSAGSIAGSTVVLNAGPAVAVAYGSAGGFNLPTLGLLTMPRPTGVSSGATISQIEAFLLGQPRVPPSWRKRSGCWVMWGPPCRSRCPQMPPFIRYR